MSDLLLSVDPFGAVFGTVFGMIKLFNTINFVKNTPPIEISDLRDFKGSTVFGIDYDFFGNNYTKFHASCDGQIVNGILPGYVGEYAIQNIIDNL